MILGFGCQEETTAINIIEECIAVKAKDKNKFESEVKNIHKKYYNLQEEYSKLDRNKAPERYSYFWHSIYEIYRGYIITFKFSHINRQHPFSPDGWAMLKTRWIAQILFEDEPLDEEISIYKQV